MIFKDGIVLSSFILLVLFLSIGIATANENNTVENNVLDANYEATADEVNIEYNGVNYEKLESNDINEEYNAKIIAKDVTLEYDEDYELIIYIEDNNHNPIEMASPLFEDYLSSWYDSNGYYHFFPMYIDVGTHQVEFSLDDGLYKAEPVTINLKILPSTFYGDIKCKSYYGTDKTTLTMKATIYDPDYDCYEDGYVTFKVNGKSYKVKTKNGVATKTIKIKKAGTYTYTAKFTNNNYKSSVTGKAKLHVYSTSKKARTFKIGKYKHVLSTDKYKKLVNAKNTGKTVYCEVKTSKFLKQSYRKYSNNGRYTIKTVNARVYFLICYGGKNGAQGALPNKYSMYFTTRYQYPDSFCTPSIVGNKQSTEINKLNKAKTKKYMI